MDEVTFALGQLKRFQACAVAAPEDYARTSYIDAAHIVVLDLRESGLISAEQADELQKTWVREFAAARINSLPADQARLELWQSRGLGSLIPRAERIAMIGGNSETQT